MICRGGSSLTVLSSPGRKGRILKSKTNSAKKGAKESWKQAKGDATIYFYSGSGM